MSDIFSKKKRSEVMSKIRGKGNKSTEVRLMKFFRAKGISGWRRNSTIFGRPDFVFPKMKAAVFADGCFWHGHSCRDRLPKSNRGFWKNKIAANRRRDARVSRRLRREGWKVFRIWECQLRNESKTTSKMGALRAA